jgi:hypothetical protein
MNFNLAEFIKDNLISGYNNEVFAIEQVNIFAINYLSKGQISQEDFNEIQTVLYPPEPEES